MKKLTTMFLSLLMCFSLLAVTAQAAFLPDPDGPGIIDVGGIPVKPGDDDPDEPGCSIQSDEGGLPGHRNEVPTD